MSGQEMPIFTRTFDFLTWLLPITNHFPTAHRNTFKNPSVPACGGTSSRSIPLGTPKYERGS